MGDYHDDPRKGIEDGYIFFLPENESLKKNHFYLPKFVNEELLYPEQDDQFLTVFIDHYTCQQRKEKDLAKESINEVFRQISTSEVELKIYYPTSKGIEINPVKPEIPLNDEREIYKYVNFDEIAKIYRKTHIFFPTHRETQGMVAQEIGACGGITLMQKWMYPEKVHYQFPHLLYNTGTKIDFKKIKQYILLREIRDKFRLHVMANCGFKNFSNKLIDTILSLC